MKDDSQYSALLRLWIFRIFENARARLRLIGKRGFRDDDVAVFLGLAPGPTIPCTFVLGMDLDDYEYDPEEAHEKFRELHAMAEAEAGKLRMPGLIEDNFRQIAMLVGLDQVEIAVLQFLAVRQTESVFTDTFNVLDGVNLAEFTRISARALRLDPGKVAAALSPRGHLVQSGLVVMKECNRMPNRLPVIFSPSLAEALLTESVDARKLMREIVAIPPPPTLGYADYPHLKKQLDLLRPYLRKAVRTGQRGVNIFIYGKPGTGKSELSRVLARELRCPLYEVSSEDKDGDPVAPKDRLNSLRMANSLLGKRSLLAFDEAEDVFSDGSLFNPSTAQIRKAWINRMLESNKIPTIWISNSVRGLDPANVRRFDFVFEIPVAPRRQRERSYRKICADLVTPDTIRRIAEAEALAPAVVARANKVVASLKGQLAPAQRDEALMQLIDGTLKAQGSRQGLGASATDRLPSVYNVEYLNCATDLQVIRESLAVTPACRICLYGPPGTGKTSCAHWLARELGRPLHVRRASDILSPYVGMTEQNFASVFAQASEEDAILLLDEVDSFLQDRRQAVRGWEVTQVNEMLTQMEAFKGVFIASTNLMDNLDQAALRRFDLKLYFDYLKPDQAVRLFSAHCRSLKLPAPAPVDLERIASITTLTPGDFANVARQHPFRRFPSPAAFLDAALGECALKRLPVKAALGFG